MDMIRERSKIHFSDLLECTILIKRNWAKSNIKLWRMGIIFKLKEKGRKR
jgi:hypothetical protein